jgi:hypothetical protein
MRSLIQFLQALDAWREDPHDSPMPSSPHSLQDPASYHGERGAAIYDAVRLAAAYRETLFHCNDEARWQWLQEQDVGSILRSLILHNVPSPKTFSRQCLLDHYGITQQGLTARIKKQGHPPPINTEAAKGQFFDAEAVNAWLANRSESPISE